jgi:hypothetical protein
LSKVESLKKISKWSLRQKSFRSKNKWLITSSKVRLGLLKANKYWPFLKDWDFDVLISQKNIFDEVIKWHFRRNAIRRSDPVSSID